MKDEEIQDVLRRVRPSSPPAGLRARIVEARPARSSRPWLTAAAALLIATAGLQWAAHGQWQTIRVTFPPQPSADAALEDARRSFELTDIEVRALTLKQDLDTIMAGEQAARQRQP